GFDLADSSLASAGFSGAVPRRRDSPRVDPFTSGPPRRMIHPSRAVVLAHACRPALRGQRSRGARRGVLRTALPAAPCGESRARAPGGGSRVAARVMRSDTRSVRPVYASSWLMTSPPLVNLGPPAGRRAGRDAGVPWGQLGM